MPDKQIPHDRNKPYNHLPILPPEDEKIISLDVLKALNEANKALAELKGYAKKLPNQSMLVNTIALREAKASSAIENIFTTDDELYQAISINDTGLNQNAKEVLKYRQALWTGFEHIQKNKKVDLKLMIQLYQEVKEMSDGIRPAQTETVIKKRGNGLLSGNVIYTPPRGEHIIEEKLNNLIEFINDDEKYDYDPLLKLAISHYQFEAIHPFRDGNGRTGRILCILLLVQKGLIELPILYLSAFIINKKDDYYHLLNQVTSQRTWKNWILYILQAVEETSKYTIQKIEQIDRLYQTTTEFINTELPHIRKETIEKIFEQPYISPKSLIDQNVKSVNTAKKYLKEMEQLGITSPKKVGKEIIYINVDLLNILSES